MSNRNMLNIFTTYLLILQTSVLHSENEKDIKNDDQRQFSHFQKPRSIYMNRYRSGDNSFDTDLTENYQKQPYRIPFGGNRADNFMPENQAFFSLNAFEDIHGHDDNNLETPPNEIFDNRDKNEGKGNDHQALNFRDQNIDDLVDQSSESGFRDLVEKSVEYMVSSYEDELNEDFIAGSSKRTTLDVLVLFMLFIFWF